MSVFWVELRSNDEQASSPRSALSATPQAADFDRQGCGLRWPDGNEREVRQHVPTPAPLRIDFCIVLTFFKIDWSNAPVYLAAWTAQLSTQASGHPLPVARYARGAVCPA